MFATVAILLAFVVGTGAATGYAAARNQQRQAQAVTATGGDPAKAQDHIQRFGCGSCHTVAGVPVANGLVGPPLQQIRDRVYVGSRTNTVDNLVEWITNPRAVNPNTPMPITGISSSQARDIVAFLYAR
jgi:cytochrome c